MAYTAATAVTALDAAVASLRTERDAATAGDAPAIAALLEQAARRVEAGRDRIRGIGAASNWTPQRAVDTLAAAAPPVPARVLNDRAVVELPNGARLLIDPWAQAVPEDPRVGYSVSIVGPSGLFATRVRAADNPSLASVVGRLYSGAA